MPQEEIQEWEKKFYEAITIVEFAGNRKDMVYEVRERAGLGMTKLKEEYECNRLRTLAQIMRGKNERKGTNSMGTKTID